MMKQYDYHFNYLTYDNLTHEKDEIVYNGCDHVFRINDDMDHDEYEKRVRYIIRITKYLRRKQWYIFNTNEKGLKTLEELSEKIWDNSDVVIKSKMSEIKENIVHCAKCDISFESVM